MRQILAIFAIAFYVLPLQTHAQPDKTKQATEGKQPANPTANPFVQQTIGAEPTGECQQHVKADVGIVSTPPKDLYDKAAFWVNVALAGVGFFGIGVGVRTLIYLRKQAGEMRLQRKVMVRSLRAMREQGDRENRSIILQYRPRIIIRNAAAREFTLEPAQVSDCNLSFQIANTGGSPAYIVGGALHLTSATATSVDDITLTHGPQAEFGERTLQPGGIEFFEDTLSTGVVIDAHWLDFHQNRRSAYSVFLMGTLWYRDDLGIPRQTGISRRYDPKNRRFVPEKDSEQEYSD